ncbi:hypothetical protein EV426DRAFT_222245 [Tirmania nivea]|nr:hypothetical protein EV426DRAFT_222245 [Tirmania nivea]
MTENEMQIQNKVWLCQCLEATDVLHACYMQTVKTTRPVRVWAHSYYGKAHARLATTFRAKPFGIYVSEDFERGVGGGQKRISGISTDSVLSYREGLCTHIFQMAVSIRLSTLPCYLETTYVPVISIFNFPVDGCSSDVSWAVSIDFGLARHPDFVTVYHSLDPRISGWSLHVNPGFASMPPYIMTDSILRNPMDEWILFKGLF